MSTIRPPAVAGFFYPADPAELANVVRRSLAEAQVGVDEDPPKALIAPHAGYAYSGPVAASAYARLAPARGRIRRVVLLGPAHRVPIAGLAVPDVDAFATPLGNVDLDLPAITQLMALPQVSVRGDAHRLEHSLEVHLPFLQEVLGEFSLVPLVVGEATADEVAEVIELLWDEPGTLIVVSSDLSHYHDHATARRMDAATSRAIEALRAEAIGLDDACGRVPLGGLLVAAGRRGLSCRTVDLRNSGDTAGSRDEVVGYGSYVFG